MTRAAETPSERRMAENEVVFRTFNESLMKWQKQFKRVAAEEGQPIEEFNSDGSMEFYCECSDENCHKRVKVIPNNYAKIHRNPNTFIIICGHEVGSIEQVIAKTPEYCVVAKNIEPPLSANELQPTPLKTPRSGTATGVTFS